MSKFKGLLSKAEDLSNKYEDAFQKNQEEIVKLQNKLHDEKAKMTDFHKAFILQEITGEAYMEQKNVVEMIEKEIRMREKEVQSIDAYKAEDVDKIVAEINKEKPVINKKQQEEIAKVKKQLADAKQEYLTKVSEIGNTYDEAVNGENLFQNMLVKLGRQKDNYSPNKHEILHGIGTVTDETISNYL